MEENDNALSPKRLLLTVDIVRTYQPKTVYMGRLTYGTDILASLEAFCQGQGVQIAWVSLLGAVSEVTLAYYNQETLTYHTRHFVGELEILNGTGNFTLKEGKPFAHVHLILSNTDFGCIGGHLMRGTTKIFACEFSLTVLTGEEPLNRDTVDRMTGLPLWCQEI